MVDLLKRNKTKGGAFTGDDKDFITISVDDDKVIPAFREVIVGMKVGCIDESSFLVDRIWVIRRERVGPWRASTKHFFREESAWFCA